MPVFCRLAKKYRHHKTHKHIEYGTDRNLTGTARYASINAHAGVEQSRRDDMESLGYVFLYFLRGSLPWQGLSAKTKEDKYKLIWKKKETTTVAELCEGFPDAFAKYLTYCREMSFNQQPDYGHLKRLFRDVFFEQGFKMDFAYDWTTSQTHENKSTSTRENQAVRRRESNLKRGATIGDLTPSLQVPDRVTSKEAAVREFYSRSRKSSMRRSSSRDAPVITQRSRRSLIPPRNHSTSGSHHTQLQTNRHMQLPRRVTTALNTRASSTNPRSGQQNGRHQLQPNRSTATTKRRQNAKDSNALRPIDELKKR
uniref:Non-specific serine/threonine protein kinase n=1 Tax=Lotharella globosa TaxID=91324 RepID=A0A7S3ZAT3_9EUKA